VDRAGREGPAFDEYASGSGQYAEQALRRLADRLGLVQRLLAEAA